MATGLLQALMRGWIVLSSVIWVVVWGLVIAGDVIAHRFGLRLRSRGFTVDIAQEILSVKRVANLEFDIICFGHGSPLMHKARPTTANFADKLTLFSKLPQK